MEVDDNYSRSGLIMDITVCKDQAKNVYIDLTKYHPTTNKCILTLILTVL